MREGACSALGQLKASDSIFDLLHDEVFAVRKAAAYYIREVPKQNHIAEQLWDMLISAQVAGVNATETLESYVVHSSDADINERLCELARSDQRESVRSASIRQLEKRKARQHLQSLIPILFEEPLVTWAAHDHLLGACVNLQIAVPHVERLIEIDDLHLQSSLAQLLAVSNIVPLRSARTTRSREEGPLI